MFILFSISRELEFWSVNKTPVHESSESKVFKTVKFLGGMFNNWTKDSLGLNLYKTLEFYG